MPRKNQVTGAPEEWFDPAILNSLGYIGFSFDFFVNWQQKPNTITPYAWVKKILDSPPSKYVDDSGRILNDDIIALLKEAEGEDYLINFSKYCNKQGLTLQYLLFRDIDWARSPEPIIVVTISGSEDLVYDIQFVGLTDLQTRIRNYSGGSVKIGSKGLIYGTSTLECYLSRSDSLYPGDADLVIVDKGLNDIALIEFKKHNLNTPISSQKLGNYYPYPDGRKYNRLAILRDFLKSETKLVNLYYPTKSNNLAKVEHISGSPFNLTSAGYQEITLPRRGQSDTYTRFVSSVIDFCRTS